MHRADRDGASCTFGSQRCGGAMSRPGATAGACTTIPHVSSRLLVAGLRDPGWRTRWRSLLLAAVAAAVGVVAVPAIAQSLPPSLVQPAGRLPPPARAELERHRAALAAMDATQRDDFRQRIAQWEAQVPALQRERRTSWQAWRALPADEQRRIDAAAQAYRALPPDQQQALRARFDDLDGSERRGWLLGPTLGGEYPRLHALLSQVPSTQRDAALAALRAMPPESRADLTVLAQRTPPQERDDLRTRWLAVAPAQRAAWLKARLGR